MPVTMNLITIAAVLDLWCVQSQILGVTWLWGLVLWWATVGTLVWILRLIRNARSF